jgi:ABC-type bacteriocin/lantibiotic exporter with double-glycine peptidase domain
MLAAALWLAGCGAALAVGSASMWLDVPFVLQKKQGCGDACIAMVMQYWQQKLHQPAQPAADAAVVLRELPPGRHGVRTTQMAGYFQQHNYRTFTYAGDWDDIEHQIAKGRPLIVALRPQGDTDLHYVVVAGVDGPEQVVLENDPAQRKLLKEDRPRFEREWRATDNWTLLAVPELK